MARERGAGTRTEVQLTGVGETVGQSFHDACAVWADVSPRFRSFLAEHDSKIAKKLRNADGEEGRRDLLLELYTAHWLLLDRRFTLEYEKYTADKIRGPDFSLVFKTHTRFNVEVKRLRAAGAGDFGRWAYVVCDKLGQMPPSVINVLLMGIDDATTPDADAPRRMARLQMLADCKDDKFFVQRGLRGAKDYLRQIQRLSAVVLIAGWEQMEGGLPSVWVNRQAKHPVPPDLQRVLAAAR